MNKKIALVGNPNCGKTTFFNLITGENQYVGNWPGVTVEQKIGKSKYKDAQLEWIDLPGIYSLVPYSMEETVSRDYLKEEPVDFVLNIVDATNIERSLYLTLQLLEMNLPVLLVLNMMDVVRKKGIEISKEELSKQLNIPVFEISAAKEEGINPLLSYIVGHQREVKSYDWSVYQNLDFQKQGICQTELPKETKWERIQEIEVCREQSIQCNKDESSLCDEMRTQLIEERYKRIEQILKTAYQKREKSEEKTDQLDRWFTNSYLSLPIFFAIMAVIYYLSVQSIGKTLVELFDRWINVDFANLVQLGLQQVGASQGLRDLVVNGILSGVGSVITFLPQIALIFFFIAILEDSGYMARVALVMDRFFRKFGLSGKAFIPMMVGTGCSVPGIMAARTLDSDKERKLVIILTPFISCSAKLPVYVLFASAFFPKQAGLVLFMMYFLGILWMFFSAFLLNRFLIKEPNEGLLIELPNYKIPKLKNVLKQVWDRSKSFLKKAGTVIFVASILIWALQNFNFELEKVENPKESILAEVGKQTAPIFSPLGFGEWEPTVAVLTGVAAKEAVVSTLGVLNDIEEADEKNEMLLNKLQGMFSPMAAISFILFILLSSPCISAMIAMYKELNSIGLTIFALLYQTGLAWVVSMLVYQIGSRIFG